MKLLKYIKISFLTLTFITVFSTGCKDAFLDENPVTTLTTDVYYKTEQGFEDLVRSCYPLLRNIHQARHLVFLGTDIFSLGGYGSPVFDKAPANAGALHQYDVSFNATVPEIQTLWTLLYTEIARTNTVVSRAAEVTYAVPATKDIRVSEAKFLRALCYFYLVQQWGDVPMPITETTKPSKEAIRVPSATVYTQIITDLLECEAKLPATASQYGRITKSAAQFLLARVYLTRGWNFKNALGGTNADFTTACNMLIKS